MIVTAAAGRDLGEAVAWYEERKPGLGKKLLEAFDSAIGTIADNPLRYRVVTRETRLALLRSFPYCIFYRAFEAEVQVVAFRHGSRNAEWHRERLEE